MKAYGETVRQLRQEKGYLQKEIYHNVVAKSFAIRFEKGEVMLKYDTFLEVLANLNLTAEEFHFIHRGYELKVEDTLWVRFAKAANQTKNRSLLELYQQEKDSKIIFHKVVAYLAHILAIYRQHSLTEFEELCNQKERAFLQEYLLKRDAWTIDETNIFTSCYFIFEHDIKKILMKNCYRSLRKYQNYRNYLERMTNLLSNYILHCYEIGEYQEANMWFVKLQSLPRRKEFLYQGLRIDLCEAYYVYTKNDFVQAEKSINNFYSAMVCCHYEGEAENTIKEYRKFKEQFDSKTIKIIR